VFTTALNGGKPGEVHLLLKGHFPSSPITCHVHEDGYYDRKIQKKKKIINLILFKL
jgi:hypothetical protein